MSWDIAYYVNAYGDTPVVDRLLSLPEKERAKCMQYIGILMENGPRLTTQYAKHIDGGIWNCLQSLAASKIDSSTLPSSRI